MTCLSGCLQFITRGFSDDRKVTLYPLKHPAHDMLQPEYHVLFTHREHVAGSWSCDM